MQQIPLQIPEILKYGIIGLGALLGILTYFLISKEQSSTSERPKLLTAIYVFMVFSIILIVFGLITDIKKESIRSQSIKDSTDSTINRLTNNNGKDNFFLGEWLGKGEDVLNRGFADPTRDGYTYEFIFRFSIDSLNRIHLDGTYKAIPKTPQTDTLKERTIAGICVKDGEFLRLLYDTHPQKNDISRGFGVMLFQFLPSNEDANGFYCSRSAKSGAMVLGKLTLYKRPPAP